MGYMPSSRDNSRAEHITASTAAPTAVGAGLPASTLPAWVTPALISETLRVWQPYYNHGLTREDAVAILLAVGRLFGVVARRSRPGSCGG